MTGCTAARQSVGEWPVWAVLVGQIETVRQGCGDAANGSNEPVLPVFYDAAKVRFREGGNIAHAIADPVHTLVVIAANVLFGE
jgi:hypothetical protein